MSLESARKLYLAIGAAQAVADEMRERSEEATRAVDALKTQMLSILNEAGVSSLRFPEGGSVSKSVRWSVRTPATPDARAAFFEYLQSRGEYDQLRTVNYQALNSWYKARMEEAKESGELDPEIPGLEPATAQEILSVRKS